MKTKLLRLLILAAALLVAVDGASAGAPPKFGRYKGTVRVAKTWPGVATTRSTAAVSAVYVDPQMPPITTVSLQYRPSPSVSDFWTESISDAIWITNMGADGKGLAQHRDASLNWIGGEVIGQRTSMVIKLSRDGDGGHPAVQITIALRWIGP